MTDEPLEPPPPDFRIRALLCATSACASGVRALLSLHPRAAALRDAAPLGNAIACRAAARLREPAFWKVPPAVCDRWRDACTRAMRHVTGEKVVSTLGRSLLAALFRRLPDRERRDATRVSRSSLPRILEQDQFLEPATQQELLVGQNLIKQRLRAPSD